ncbi:hypothetical protein KAU11_01960, partial [Candidatus Babeliales bacterium]|nr:hypothetical protein [Candidatus Babeliales bacterium]
MKKKYFFLMSLFLFALPKMAFLAESGEEVVESMIINHRHSDYADVFAGSNKPSVTLKTPRDISKAGDRLEKIIKSNMKRQKMNSVVKRQLALALPLYKESLNDSCGCFFKPDA